MSEYELADLFVEWGKYQELLLERFIYLLFAFIVAGHLVAAKLKPGLLWIIVVLYSYMALRYILVYSNVIDDQIALADLIAQHREQPNSELQWLRIDVSLSAILYSQAIAMFISYVASLVFFFYSRKVNAIEDVGDTSA